MLRPGRMALHASMPLCGCWRRRRTECINGTYRPRLDRGAAVGELTEPIAANPLFAAAQSKRAEVPLFTHSPTITTPARVHRVDGRAVRKIAARQLNDKAHTRLVSALSRRTCDALRAEVNEGFEFRRLVAARRIERVQGPTLARPVRKQVDQPHQQFVFALH